LVKFKHQITDLQQKINLPITIFFRDHQTITRKK
jgi:hypothetical protein